MAELNDELKLEIVTRLARFETLTDIENDFRSRDIECSARQIGSYDPTRTYYEAGDRWREIFTETRRLYIENVSAVPIANQTYRLEVLQRGVAALLKAGKWSQAATLAAQAAGEVGGQYTNVRDVNISDSRRMNPRDMTPEERQNVMADLIRKALETMPPEPGVEQQQGTVQ